MAEARRLVRRSLGGGGRQPASPVAMRRRIFKGRSHAAGPPLGSVVAAGSLYDLQTPKAGSPAAATSSNPRRVTIRRRRWCSSTRRTRCPGDGVVRNARNKGVRWLLKRQKPDGAGSALQRISVRIRFVKLFAKDSRDLAPLFVESSADDKDHSLGARGACGLRLNAPRAAGRAARPRGEAQDAVAGYWKGRWGTGHQALLDPPRASRVRRMRTGSCEALMKSRSPEVQNEICDQRHAVFRRPTPDNCHAARAKVPQAIGQKKDGSGTAVTRLSSSVTAAFNA